MENIGAHTPAPENPFSVLANAVEPDGVDPLWQELGKKFCAMKRDKLEIGRLLHELNVKYAEHGQGTFIKRVLAFEFFNNIQTAYNWMNAYREYAGIKVAQPKPYDGDDISAEELEAIKADSTKDGAPPIEREKPTGSSYTVWVTLSEKKRLDSLVRRIVTFGMVNKQTTSFGKPIDNKNDAVVWAMELVAESEEVQSFFEQEEKKHHETSPQ
jgi:hypothetical protein